MARQFGAQDVTTNYEIQVRKPFDARTLVTSYGDLLTKSNWIKEGTESQIVAYNGMIVAVADTSDTSKNGIYFLFDVECTTYLKSPDVTNEANWIKVGETTDISDFVARISNIEEELVDFDDRITELENKVVETYGYRSGFPTTGVEGRLYVAVDEQRTYVWTNAEFVPVGANPDIIYGGKA